MKVGDIAHLKFHYRETLCAGRVFVGVIKSCQDFSAITVRDVITLWSNVLFSSAHCTQVLPYQTYCLLDLDTKVGICVYSTVAPCSTQYAMTAHL